jgi:hypothetical protein
MDGQTAAAEPAGPVNWRAQWECQLSGLRDLNQSMAAVGDESRHWLAWYQDQFKFQGMRIDAMGHVPPVRLRYPLPQSARQ